MDENTAWRNFAETGSVGDYLTYCRIRSDRVSCGAGDRTEDFDENGNGGSDPDRHGSRRERQAGDRAYKGQRDNQGICKGREESEKSELRLNSAVQLFPTEYI